MKMKKPEQKTRRIERPIVEASSRERRRSRKPKRPDPPGRKTVEESGEKPARGDEFPVVAVGASAGGLEAFTHLLQHLPADTGMAFVLIQHLDPSHASMLPEILPRSTKMPVVEVRDGTRIGADRVYVIPPAARVTVTDGAFRLVSRPKGSVRELPIDLLFESLAEHFKSAAIGVILSGTLSDGALGLKAIKAEGGITFAQDEASAKFPAMPRAAIALGSVDFVLPPEQIAAEIVRVARHISTGVLPLDPAAAVGGVAAGKRDEAVDRQASSEEAQLDRIFQMLQKTTAVDFGSYRPTTIRRRIARRMLVNRVETLTKYVQFLGDHPEEVHSLYEDILITVTGFFRDPESFQALKTLVFPAMLKNRAATNPVRIWVPGCSTGEEAYSIAILLLEYMGEAGINPPVQLFATDVSETAIEKGRAGAYLENAVVDVSPERLRRFFTRVDGGYQISKAVRDVCIFARQNVAADPPFSNMDLLSCRNLLIYLEPALQRRIVPLFHYALKADGFLLLGRSETLTSYPELFHPIDRNHRIYAKRPGARPAVEFGQRGLRAPAHESPIEAVKTRQPPDPQREADRVILTRFTPPGVLVNDALEIVQFRGRTSPYLEAASGTPSLNVLKMAREGLLVDLRTAIMKARRSGIRVRSGGVRVRQDGNYREVDLEVVPIKGDGEQETHYLILFEERRAEAGPKPTPRRRTKEGEKSREETIVKLEQELTATKDYLQSIIEEQEAANEELKSANEEILSSNEELQSTNEELETAKEELQSANEELTTVNEELANRNVEIATTSGDLLNLISSINTAIVMVGLEGRIRRFTPVAERLLNLSPADLNRPLSAVRPNFEGPDLADLVQQTVETVEVIEREVQMRDGKWYSLQVRPYRTLDNRIDGAILLFIDIDPLKRTIEQANRSRDYAQALVETMRESLIVLDRNLRIRTANRSFYETYQVSPISTEGKLLFEVGGDWAESGVELRSRLFDVAARNEQLQDFEFGIELPHAGHKTMVANARQVRLPGETAPLVLLTLEDVTENRRATEELRSSEERYRRLFETAREAIWLVDGASGEILDANPFASELLGFSRNEFAGRKSWDLPVYAAPGEARARFEKTIEAGYGFTPDVEMRARDGRTLHVEKVSSVYTVGSRQIVQLNMRDLTERLRLEEELRHAQKMESIGRLAGGIAHDFNNILNIISAYSTLLAKGNAEKRPQSLEAIEKAVERGAALVRQLLTFARRESMKLEPVDVNAVVREVASMVRETFPRSIAIRQELDPELPTIPANASQIHQALLNLSVNARDAMPDGGTLGFTTAIARGETLRGRRPDAVDDRYLCVGVSDTGVGMDEKTRNQIFEPFFSTKGKEQGSGLGLAVVYGIVNTHGGFVEVESVPGDGSRFSIYMPIRSTDEPGDRVEAREPLSSTDDQNQSIEAAEDQDLLRAAIRPAR
jgi:two-component system CheB/CheR fusion protein